MSRKRQVRDREGLKDVQACIRPRPVVFEVKAKEVLFRFQGRGQHSFGVTIIISMVIES